MFDSSIQAFQTWYVGLSDAQAIAFLFTSLIACFVVLSKGADFLVDGAAGLAGDLGVPKIIIGATVVSLGTTLPEASASVIASLKGSSELATANAIGSIICNAGLVFGLCCTIVRLPVSRFTFSRNAWFQIGGAALFILLFLLADTTAGGEDQRHFYRSFGIILLAGLLVYTLMSVRWAKQSSSQNNRNNNSNTSMPKIGKSILLTIIGFVLVIMAAFVLVPLIEDLALKLGVPKDIVGITILALGTSIPELATGIMSLIKGHRELLVGNVIGANVLNIFFVMGASATVQPLAKPFLIPDRFLWLHLPVMLVILGLFHLNIWTSKTHLKRWPGLLMLIVYLTYVVGSYAL